MSAEVAEAIRQTRRTLAEKTWVPWFPVRDEEVCVVDAIPGNLWSSGAAEALETFADLLDWCPEYDDYADIVVATWNDRQSDVGAVLGMTLQALIAELCKPTLAPRTTEA